MLKIIIIHVNVVVCMLLKHALIALVPHIDTHGTAAKTVEFFGRGCKQRQWLAGRHEDK